MPKKPYRIERWNGKEWRYCTSFSKDCQPLVDRARRVGSEYGGCSVRALNTGMEGWPCVYQLQGADDAVF